MSTLKTAEKNEMISIIKWSDPSAKKGQYRTLEIVLSKDGDSYSLKEMRVDGKRRKNLKNIDLKVAVDDGEIKSIQLKERESRKVIAHILRNDPKATFIEKVVPEVEKPQTTSEKEKTEEPNRKEVIKLELPFIVPVRKPTFNLNLSLNPENSEKKEDKESPGIVKKIKEREDLKKIKRNLVKKVEREVELEETDLWVQGLSPDRPYFLDEPLEPEIYEFLKKKIALVMLKEGKESAFDEKGRVRDDFVKKIRNLYIFKLSYLHDDEVKELVEGAARIHDDWIKREKKANPRRVEKYFEITTTEDITLQKKSDFENFMGKIIRNEGLQNKIREAWGFRLPEKYKSYEINDSTITLTTMNEHQIQLEFLSENRFLIRKLA